MANVSDDYYRVYRALHLVTHEAVQCVDHCVKVWHQNQALAPCTTQCPDGRKPKSCQQCVAWAKAIEGVHYSPSKLPSNASQVNWSNISPSILGKSHIEVAKAFVLRLPKTTGSATQYTAMSDFDSASLLMIMARFREFHRTDQTSYDQIMKVFGIRNDLSHVKLKANMQFDQQKVKQYFKDIEDFVTCLENLHPVHFTSGHNIKGQLKEIQLEPVSKKMRKEIHLEMQQDLESVRQTVTELKRELHATTSELKHVVRDANINIPEKDYFIRCWRALDCVVTRSIPCLRSALKQWQENKRKTIEPCQRPRPRPPEIQDECSEEGKPVPGSSCANCVAWGKAVEDEYCSLVSKAIIPWDTINPMCLARSHFMIAKAFVSKSSKATKCTKLEDLDLGCLLDIMERFKGFLGQDRSSHDIVGKILGIKYMLIQMHEKDNFNLNDQEVDDVFSHVYSFISFLEVTHPKKFAPKDADDIRKAIKQIQQETVTYTRKMLQDVDMQIRRCGNGSSSTTSELKEQIQSIDDKLDKVVKQIDAAQIGSDNREKFIKSCTAIYYTVTKSIPCLRKVLQRWHSAKRKSTQGCQRVQSASNQECKTEGKPTTASSCANCVAWGEAVEGAYYPRKSKGDIQWDTIDPTCLSESIVMVAKAFVSNSDKVKECTQLEDLDLDSILEIMRRFKDFLGGEKRTHQIVTKISDVISMLTEMRIARAFHLKDQKFEEIFQSIEHFVACLVTLHSEWFSVGDAEDIRKTIMKIKKTPFSEWIKEGLPRVHEMMEAFGGNNPDARLHNSRRAGNSRQEYDATLKKCQEELRRYYLDSLCKIPLFPGDYDSYVDLKNIYTKLSFEIKLPSPCKPVKMPLFSYAEMFERRLTDGIPYTRFLISAPAGLGKTTLTSKIAYDWVTKEEERLKDVDLLFVINMRSVERSSNLEDVILDQLFPKDTIITSEDISSLLRKYSRSSMIIFDAIDESDRNLYDRQNRGSLVEFLTGKILLPCKMLTTTRPWRIGQITQECRAFAQVEISGFNKNDIREYIKKFFREDKELGESLIRHANQNKLIDEIAYIPLMSLLICVYWREVQEECIPHRIGQLYDAVINIMHDHFLKKQDSAGQYDDIKPLLYQMGKMALGGFWPPENRVVFSPSEMTSSESVESACQMGFLIKQESRPSIIKRYSRTNTTLTFFHKTCGEKFAGEYLAHIAEEESIELRTKLSQLKTADDALSVRLILQFACGSSKKAAKEILTWLRRLSFSDRSVCLDVIKLHTLEKLELEETLKIQNFIDLCLRCNYEANCAAEFSLILSRFFTERTIFQGRHVVTNTMIVFLGISEFTSVALGYYLSNTQSQIDWGILLRPAAHPSHIYGPDDGPLVRISEKNREDINNININIIREICKEYIQKHPDMHDMNKVALYSSPSTLLHNIHMWQACEGLPTPDESDFGPIFESTEAACMRLIALDLRYICIPKRNMENLLEMIRRNHLSSLRFINVSFTSMSEKQMLDIAENLKRIPNLVLLGISQFEPMTNRFLSILARSMPSMKSLQFLHIDNVTTSADDMAQFVCKFPCFASQLIELTMDQHYPGALTNTVASILADNLVFAEQLGKFKIYFDMFIHQTIQNKCLSQLCHLSRLYTVEITFEKYLNDVVKTIAGAIKTLTNLQQLSLICGAHLTIDTTTWKIFKTTLMHMERLLDLRLLQIRFKEEDFADLLAVCREKHYNLLFLVGANLVETKTVIRVTNDPLPFYITKEEIMILRYKPPDNAITEEILKRYSTVCVPRDFPVLNDEFLTLR